MLEARRLLAAALTLACIAACSRREAPPPPAAETPPAPAAALACDTATTPPPDSNFPAGFDYPQQTASWVTAREGDRMRTHGWCLFAGLNQQAQANAEFNWQAWKTSTQVFPYQYNPWPLQGGGLTQRPASLNAKNAANASTAGPNPINIPNPPVYPLNAAILGNPAYKQCLMPAGCTTNCALRDGESFENNGDIMVAGVIYNDAAAANIQSSSLFDAGVLNSELPLQPTDRSNSIGLFPPASIVLKTMMWPVARGGFTVLPVWDWEAHLPGSADDGKYAGYEMKAMWTRAVAITDLPNPTPPPAVKFLHGVLNSDGTPLGPNTYDNTHQTSPPAFTVASVRDFYHRQYQQADLDALSACDRAILDASAYWTYDRAFEAGDYLVLMATHILTKEQPDWTFQSVWWHPDAKACPDSLRFCGDRPTNLADTTFQNYMLTTTYGQAQKQTNPPKDNYYAPAGTLGAVWPVAYNPYIELAAAHPITTNCMNCHHRAAWPPRAELDKPDEGRTSAYLQAAPPNPNALELFDSGNQVFNGLLMLDSMWAVSDRAAYRDAQAAAQAARAKEPKP